LCEIINHSDFYIFISNFVTFVISQEHVASFIVGVDREEVGTAFSLSRSLCFAPVLFFHNNNHPTDIETDTHLTHN